MISLDVIASHAWYVDHIRPVWEALPEEYRGKFYTTSGAPANKRPTLVASSGDMFVARRLGRPVALMEHGAGQSYGGDARAKRHSSYAGGDSRQAELFLHPGPRPAARDLARYPNSRVELIGCPKLDTLPRKEVESAKPVIAVSFHWDCQVAPETRSSFIYFRGGIKKSDDFEVIGHSHPRMFQRLVPWYEKHGIEPVKSFDEVLRRADLYAVDNSSTLFEFAATGRPVLVMNPPFYRRSVNHGLRFWEAAEVGLNVSSPGDWMKAAGKALLDPPSRKEAREDALSIVYSYREGAAQRAAEYLVDWLNTRK